LSSVELAPFTASYDVLGVRHRRGPVEPCRKAFPTSVLGPV
jgi:hypothetical protein